MSYRIYKTTVVCFCLHGWFLVDFYIEVVVFFVTWLVGLSRGWKTAKFYLLEWLPFALHTTWSKQKGSQLAGGCNIKANLMLLHVWCLKTTEFCMTHLPYPFDPWSCSCSSPKRCTCIFFGGVKIARLVSSQKPSHKAEVLQMWKSQVYELLSTRTNMKINPKQLYRFF